MEFGQDYVCSSCGEPEAKRMSHGKDSLGTGTASRPCESSCVPREQFSSSPTCCTPCKRTLRNPDERGRVVSGRWSWKSANGVEL